MHTITYDKGREFSDHAGMVKDLEYPDLLCPSVCILGTGCQQNTNDLIPQFFPKDQDLRDVTNQQLTKVMNTLNHRPRKTLGYRTPHEGFFDTTAPLTVALTN